MVPELRSPVGSFLSPALRASTNRRRAATAWFCDLGPAYCQDSPVIVPVLVAKRSVSIPTSCSTETYRLGSG